MFKYMLAAAPSTIELMNSDKMLTVRLISEAHYAKRR
jgi:hypothetical protein